MSTAAIKFDLGHQCSNCPQGEFCLGLGLSLSDAQQVDQIMRVGRPMRVGQHLVRIGDPLRAIFAVRSGSFKSTAIDCDGHEQVLGFHTASELMGLEAVYSGTHHCNVIALNTARVCVLPYKQLVALAAHIPALFERLFCLLSKDIGNNLFTLGNYSAEERVAGFLLSMARRLSPNRQLNPSFDLPMSRTDIANYLRLAIATLSRMLAHFQESGLVDIRGRTIQIHDLEKFQQLARRVPQVSV